LLQNLYGVSLQMVPFIYLVWGHVKQLRTVGSNKLATVLKYHFKQLSNSSNLRTVSLQKMLTIRVFNLHTQNIEYLTVKCEVHKADANKQTEQLLTHSDYCWQQCFRWHERWHSLQQWINILSSCEKFFYLTQSNNKWDKE
jgi:hypothetical protein